MKTVRLVALALLCLFSATLSGWSLVSLIAGHGGLHDLLYMISDGILAVLFGYWLRGEIRSRDGRS